MGGNAPDLCKMYGEGCGGTKALYSLVSVNNQPPPPEDIAIWLKWLSSIKIILRNAPSDWFVGNGRRLLNIDSPHQGADYWHLNSDLRLFDQTKGLLKLNHLNIEGLLRRLGGIKMPIIIVPVKPFRDFFEDQRPIMG